MSGERAPVTRAVQLAQLQLDRHTRRVVTVSAHTLFEAGNLIALPRLLKVGRSLVVGDVLIYSKTDQGRENALAQATMTYSIPPKN